MSKPKKKEVRRDAGKKILREARIYKGRSRRVVSVTTKPPITPQPRKPSKKKKE